LERNCSQGVFVENAFYGFEKGGTGFHKRLLLVAENLERTSLA